MERGISRRDFMKAAVSVGGASALAACIETGGVPDIPQGDPSSAPERQHAWNDYLARDGHGNVVMPRHHVLVFADVNGNDRGAVEESFVSLERAYERSNDGLLFTVGYSSAYFDGFEARGVEIPRPESLSSFEDPEFDDYDVVIHLASDYASVVLGAEEALFGDVDELNGVEVPSVGALEKRDRRTGFVGEGLPAGNQDVDGIPDSDPVPDESPLYMGFKSGFEKNQATEDAVSIDEGRFAGGTTQHVSKIRLHLQQWYEQDSRYQRVGKMFCPVHADEGLVEGTGDNLGDSSSMDDCTDTVDEHAREYGMVGHSEKMTEVRDDGSPLLLRRDFDSTDGGEAGMHFVSLQRSIRDFVETREAMNASDTVEKTAVGQKNNNGILQYMTVERRGNYLVPPRRHRSLPTPSGEGV